MCSYDSDVECLSDDCSRCCVSCIYYGSDKFEPCASCCFGSVDSDEDCHYFREESVHEQ